MFITVKYIRIGLLIMHHYLFSLLRLISKKKLANLTFKKTGAKR
jgi:hypothetical protein